MVVDFAEKQFMSSVSARPGRRAAHDNGTTKIGNREVARAYCRRFGRATGDAERHAQGYSMSHLVRKLAHLTRPLAGQIRPQRRGMPEFATPRVRKVVSIGVMETLGP